MQQKFLQVSWAQESGKDSCMRRIFNSKSPPKSANQPTSNAPFCGFGDWILSLSILKISRAKCLWTDISARIHNYHISRICRVATRGANMHSPACIENIGRKVLIGSDLKNITHTPDLRLQLRSLLRVWQSSSSSWTLFGSDSSPAMGTIQKQIWFGVFMIRFYHGVHLLQLSANWTAAWQLS